ncbi:MAG: 50S ribosomal protein L20 [Dehalococcoidia bacterium]|nr:50S ribosomal protein L20 [Dehalococcoidia bacterium]
MSRVKRGVTSRRRHRKIIARTEGHRGQRHSVFRRANESMLHALRYNYEGRKDRKGDFRRLWIVRINAAARLHGMTYSTFMHGLEEGGHRARPARRLADLAVTRPDAFEQLAGQAQEALAA